MPILSCRHFSGYKPCALNEKCEDSCRYKSIPKTRVLLVHLGALGAVVRSTALLKAIHRKYPEAHVTWVTQKPADVLLKNNPLIDRVLTTDRDDILSLASLEFDIGLCVDKSQVAAGVMCAAKVKSTFGFRVDPVTGAVLPATAAATPLWELGLSNFDKFFINKKSEIQLVTEALELDYQRDDYYLPLSEDEKSQTKLRHTLWAESNKIVVGLNTGCSDVITYKKLSIAAHRELIQKLAALNFRVVLLGGPEDKMRNQQIAEGLDVISSATDSGLRDGLISVNACDLVVTGDSLGMHMAIALGKWTVAWFGPTCDHEIDLYERGLRVKTAAPCSPCWKRSCHNSPMCYDLVDLQQLTDGIIKGAQWLTLSFTPPFSEISSLPFPFYDRSRESGPVSL